MRQTAWQKSGQEHPDFVKEVENTRMESSPSKELTVQPGKDGNRSAPAGNTAPGPASGGAGAAQPTPSPQEQAQPKAPASVAAEKPQAKWIKPVAITVVLAALFAGAIWGFNAWQFGSAHVSTDDAYLTADIVQITPQVAGSIVELPVKENQHVNKGDLLARLDDATFQADLEQAKANLANAQATVNASSLNVGLTQATGSAQIQQAQGGVGQAESAIAGAQADLKRIAAAIKTAQAQQNGSQANIKSVQAAADAAVAARKRAVSTVAGTQALVATAEAGVRTAEAGVRIAEANVEQARANYDKANKDALRYAVLYEQDAVSAQTLDTANAAAKAARAQVDSLQRQIEQAQSTVDARKADVAARRADVVAAQDQVNAADATVQQALAMTVAARDAAAAAAATVTQNREQLQVGREAVGQQVARRKQAQGVLSQAQTAPKQVAVSQSSVSTSRTRIAQAEAAVRTAQINLNRTRLVAPFDGTISKKSGEIGQQLAVGQQVMALVPDNDVWVVGNFKETQLKKVRPGQDVEVEVDALNGQKFRGRVDSISAGTGSTFALLPTDNATGNFTKVVQRVPVKIVFDRDQKGLEALRAGLSVIATISTGK
jgi:membrane fusion protein (multidrug efflux system)